MRVTMFYHSLAVDGSHGNPRFVRGVVTEMLGRGLDVRVIGPRDPASCDLDDALDGADLVLVHESTDHGLVARIGLHHAGDRSYRLLFHDTHHRTVTNPAAMSGYDLRHYDGVLAFDDRVRDFYRRHGWAHRAWMWHEANSVDQLIAVVDEIATEVRVQSRRSASAEQVNRGDSGRPIST